MPDGARGPFLGLTRRPRGFLASAAAIAALILLLGVRAEPGYAGGPAILPTQAASDLGTVRSDGVTVYDSLGSFGQANAYTFRVADGPGTIQVYVGDLWYDVEVLLLRGAAAGSAAQWRVLPCDGAAGCLTSAPPSARRSIQLVQPKGLFESVEPGSYTVLVRPREEAEFTASRQFTLRVAVTPPVCAVSADAQQRYQIALAMTPAQPGRADLVTMTAYVLPPFGDLFSFEWSVDGRPLATSGPTAQSPAFELAAGRAGGHDVQVIARGIRAYPDPDQPEIPPTLSVACPVTVG